MKTKIKTCLVVLAFSCASSISLAQGPGGPGDPGGDPGGNPGGQTDIPFDGGLSLIAAAGIAYAAKKGVDRRKKQQGQTPKNNI